MAAALLPAGLSGALFGAALAASGVFTPAVVLAQMRLEDFHMMKVFLTATAGSALIVNLFARLGLAHVAPRSSSSVGLFSVYDGNILGGLSIGFGMALAGACPGTVFVQVGAGLSSGLSCLAGGIFGGVLHASGIVNKALGPFKAAGPRNPQEVIPIKGSDLTVYGKLGVSANSVLLAFEVMCAAAIATVTFLFDENSTISLRTMSGALHPLAGGALVVSAQAASLLLTGGALGASAFYADAARYIVKASGAASGRSLQPSPKSLVFTMGVVAAGRAVTYRIPDVAFAAVRQDYDISAARSFLGGFFLAVGARVAGGCTSGHGISGMSSMSVASFASVAAMFGGGMGLAAFI